MNKRFCVLSIAFILVLVAVLFGSLHGSKTFTGGSVFADTLDPIDSQPSSNEIIVRFKPSVASSLSAMNMVHRDIGAMVKHRYDIVEGLQVVQLDDGLSVEEALRLYEENPNVLYAEPNYRFFALGDYEIKETEGQIVESDYETSLMNEHMRRFDAMRTSEKSDDETEVDKAVAESKKNSESFQEPDINVWELERFTLDDSEIYYETEPNDSINYPDIVNLNYKGIPSYFIYGTITDYYNDFDYYKFDIVAPGEIEILGIWVGDFSEYDWEEDLFIRLLDEDDNVIAAADLLYDSDVGEFRFLSKSLDPGTYYIVTSATDEWGSLYVNEPYGMHVQFVPEIIPSFSHLWGLENTGQTIEGQSGLSGADISAVEAWNLEKGSSEVVVAVVDSGVDYTHPDLSSNMWTSNDGDYGWNFIDNSNDTMDDNGHGTHVAGTIAAVGGNDTEIKGVMWEADIMALKVLDSEGSAWTTDIIEAIEYANDHGAQIINLSLGGGDESSALKDVLSVSQAVVVTAAGNDGKDNDSNPIFPANYDLDHLISVAATDNRDELADFSNYGDDKVHVGAPGVNIYSTRLGGGYLFNSGTSMAAPHVTGLAGLILSVNENLSNVEVVDLIKSNVDVISDLQGKTITNGRINAKKALEATILSKDLELESVVINKDSALVKMPLTFFTDARAASVFVFDGDDRLIIPSYIQASNGKFYDLSAFTDARAATDGTVSGALKLLSVNPQFIREISPSTVEYRDGEFIILPPES